MIDHDCHGIPLFVAACTILFISARAPLICAAIQIFSSSDVTAIACFVTAATVSFNE